MSMFLSKHLNAIDNTVGCTPGEKQRTIRHLANLIASKVALGKSIDNLIIEYGASVGLDTLIRVEAAKILKDRHIITDSLMSRDPWVAYRALQAKWYFNITIDNTSDNLYYLRNLLLGVSKFIRRKIIKNLAKYQTSTKSAEKIFYMIMNQRGYNEALPILIVCGEAFIYWIITEKNIVLPQKLLFKMYKKYPKIGIWYLQTRCLGSRSGENAISMKKYKSILPLLIKRYLPAFIELIECHDIDDVSIKLSKRNSLILLRGYRDRLLMDPKRYLAFIPLYLVSGCLNDVQFKIMLEKLFPRNWEDFRFDDILKYMEYRPRHEHLDTISSMYQYLYNKNLFESYDKITGKMLQLLPVMNRVALARIMIDVVRVNSNVEDPWHCYLSINESFEYVHQQFLRKAHRNKDGGSNINQLESFAQLIHICKINNEPNALLYVMQCIEGEFMHMSVTWIYKLIDMMDKNFNVMTLGQSHWHFFHNYIVNINPQVIHEARDPKAACTECMQIHTIISNLLKKYIRYLYVNGHCIREMIKWQIHYFLTLAKTLKYFQSWIFVVNDRVYEKRYLDTTLSLIESDYQGNCILWLSEEAPQILLKLLEDMYQFNKRYRYSPKYQLNHYLWLINCITTYLYSYNMYPEKALILKFLRLKENYLYDSILLNGPPIFDSTLTHVLHLMKCNTPNLMSHWKLYLDMVHRSTNLHNVRLFFSRCAWYSYIPSTILQEEISRGMVDNNVIGLNILLSGPAFIRVMKPTFLDSCARIRSGYDNRTLINVIKMTFSCTKITGSSYEFMKVLCYCPSDYRGIALQCISRMCKFTSVPLIKSYFRTLKNVDFDYLMHGVSMIRRYGTIRDTVECLVELWMKNRTPPIPPMVFKTMHQTFITKSHLRAWELLNEFASGYLFSEYEELMDNLLTFNSVPKRYITEYMEGVMRFIECIDKIGNNPNLVLHSNVELLKSINYAVGESLTESFCDKLLATFLFQLDYKYEIAKYIKLFTIKVYLPTRKTTWLRRTRYFLVLFTQAIQTNWDTRHYQIPYCYPIKRSIYEILTELVYNACKYKYNAGILEETFDVLFRLIKPMQDPSNFLNLSYGIKLLQSRSPMDFGVNVGLLIPKFIQIFSTRIFLYMVDKLKEFLDPSFFDSNCTPLDISLGIVEGLLVHQTAAAYVIASKMLPNDIPSEYLGRLESILTTLSNVNDLVTKGLLCDYYNSIKYVDFMMQ